MSCTKCGETGHYSTTCRKRSNAAMVLDAPSIEPIIAPLPQAIEIPDDIACSMCMLPFTSNKKPLIICANEHFSCEACGERLFHRCGECRDPLLSQFVVSRTARSTLSYVDVTQPHNPNVTLSLTVAGASLALAGLKLTAIEREYRDTLMLCPYQCGMSCTYKDLDQHYLTCDVCTEMCPLIGSECNCRFLSTDIRAMCVHFTSHFAGTGTSAPPPLRHSAPPPLHSSTTSPLLHFTPPPPKVISLNFVARSS